MEFGSHTKWFDVASSPYLHKIGLEFAVPQAGVALDVGMVVGTDGMRDSDGERDECAEASNAPRCKGETGDVIDSGDPDYVRTHVQVTVLSPVKTSVFSVPTKPAHCESNVCGAASP